MAHLELKLCTRVLVLGLYANGKKLLFTIKYAHNSESIKFDLKLIMRKTKSMSLSSRFGLSISLLIQHFVRFLIEKKINKKKLNSFTLHTQTHISWKINTNPLYYIHFHFHCRNKKGNS